MSRAGAVRSSDDTLRALVSDLLDSAAGTFDDVDPLHAHYWERALLDPANDILRRPGKEFRTRTLTSSWLLAGGAAQDLPEQLALAVELLHVGSLVIDDIEDDSPMRRGEPALHRRFGVPVALNTGNWLYFLPLALLSRMGLPDKVTLSMYADISDAIVLCHQGQALDLTMQISHVRQAEVPQLVAHATQLKTGSLMRLAALLGARAAGADEQTLHCLARFGAELGVGLQMLDDWSGIRNVKRLHKGVEDVRHGRPTWPWAWLAQSCDDVTYANLVRGAHAESIDWEIERVIERMRARLQRSVPAIIHTRLAAALDRLERELGPREALDELRQQVEVLESAYG